ncbi:hypothetical protein DH2020_026724 [Rehmannia glutinosa]|uniref:Transposase MuDR plant domain-containing protein n=1 Tax=Rehmannia glutinosa TaxID=99300 RepID=A0ABR0VXT9_REHGL
MNENTQNQIDKNIEKGKRVMEMSKQVGDENCYFDQIDLDVLIDNFTEGGSFDENENSDKDDDFGGMNPSNDSGMSIDDNSEDDFDIDKSSDRENETNIVFKQGDLLNPWFEIGQTFGSKKLFSEDLHGHAIRTRRSLKTTKNDKRRIYARCVDEKCDWHINALKIFNQESFQIREYNSNHKCGRQYHVSNVSSKWLANKFVEAFRIDPSMNVKGFRNEAIMDIRWIPCKHGVSAIEALSEDPEDYVLECYSVETYCKVYETLINPMSGPMLWEKTGYIPPLPPNFGRKRGRPSRARRLGADEKGEKETKETTMH